MTDAKYELADDTLRKLEYLRSVFQEMAKTVLKEKARWEDSLATLDSKVRKDTVRKRGKERYYNPKVVDSLVEIAKHNIFTYEKKVKDVDNVIKKLEAYSIRVKRAKSDFNVVGGTNYLLNKIGEHNRTYQLDPIKEIEDVRKAVFTINGYRELL